MFIARWIIDVRFGKKEEFIEIMGRWYKDVGEKVGMDKSTLRVTTGSIGAKESRYEIEHTVESLEKLQMMWDEMGKIDAHKDFGKGLEPVIVSGSNRWEVFRIVDL